MKDSSKKKGTGPQRKGGRSKKDKENKAGEYVSCLLELHRLQGVLLADLEKEVG